MIDTQKLRLNAYSVTADGHIQCSRGERWSHERCGILQVILSKDTPATRGIVDAIIAELDEPRALTGRDSRGGAVLLFQVAPRNGINNKHVEYGLATGAGIEIIFGSENLTLNPAAFTWAKNRSPFDVERDALPPLRDDHVKTAETVAYKLGARHPSEFERERESERRVEVMRQRLANGETAESMEADRQHEEDLKIVAAHEGVQFGQFDELRQIVHGARYRVAKRAALEKAATVVTG